MSILLDIKAFRDYQLIQDWAMFGTLLIVEIFVFIRVKFRIDPLGIFTLTAQLFLII
jgi:hypothetical protein